MNCRAGLLSVALLAGTCEAAPLTAAELAVVYRAGDVVSEHVARVYQATRRVPAENVLGIDVPADPVLSPARLDALRDGLLRRAPARVRALLLVWSTPYAAGCMSITTAFAIGYRPEFCEPGCGRTALSPLFDADTLDHARRLGWRIAMLMPADESSLAGTVIARGASASGSQRRGIAYLVRTADVARNVRAPGYADVVRRMADRVAVRVLDAPPPDAVADAIAYFTGVDRVRELGRVQFVPGGVADHLTSAGGVLAAGNGQTTAVQWLRAGATGSYGTVSEPCNHVGKFPSPLVFLHHYARGDTLIEAYWKSVAMPGQGLFVGEPLAAPFAGGGETPAASTSAGPGG